LGKRANGIDSSTLDGFELRGLSVLRGVHLFVTFIALSTQVARQGRSLAPSFVSAILEKANRQCMIALMVSFMEQNNC